MNNGMCCCARIRYLDMDLMSCRALRGMHAGTGNKLVLEVSRYRRQAHLVRNNASLTMPAWSGTPNHVEWDGDPCRAMPCRVKASCRTQLPPQQLRFWQAAWTRPTKRGTQPRQLDGLWLPCRAPFPLCWPVELATGAPNHCPTSLDMLACLASCRLLYAPDQL